MLILFCLISLAQISFVHMLPSPLNIISIPMIMIFNLSLTRNMHSGLLFALIAGYLEGLYSFINPGWYVTVYAAALILLRFLFISVFSNYNFWSIFAAGSLALLFHYAFLTFLSPLFHVLKKQDYGYDPSSISKLAAFYFINIILVIAVYLLQRNKIKNRWMAE